MLFAANECMGCGRTVAKFAMKDAVQGKYCEECDYWNRTHRRKNMEAIAEDSLFMQAAKADGVYKDVVRAFRGLRNKCSSLAGGTPYMTPTFNFVAVSIKYYGYDNVGFVAYTKATKQVRYGFAMVYVDGLGRKCKDIQWWEVKAGTGERFANRKMKLINGEKATYGLIPPEYDFKL